MPKLSNPYCCFSLIRLWNLSTAYTAKRSIGYLAMIIPGAITAASSACRRDRLRFGLETTAWSTLKPLAQGARESGGWIIPAIEQAITKFAALRSQSGAHTPQEIVAPDDRTV